jgi:cob(I)alamin adenosyltransferase
LSSSYAPSPLHSRPLQSNNYHSVKLKEATAFLRRAERQIGVARAHLEKNDDKNPEAEEAIIELNGTLEEVRAYLAEDEAGDVEGDAGDDEEVSVEDEEA